MADDVHERGLYAQTELPQVRFHPIAHFAIMRRADTQTGMTPKEKIRRILSEKRLTQQEIAERLGVSQSTVNRWKAGSEPEGHRRDAISQLFQDLYDSTFSPDGYPHERMVHVVGKAGAGPQGEIVFDLPRQDLGIVAAPMNATQTTVALEVQGDSMRGIANDGWLVFYDDQRTAPSAEMYGELCVVGLQDGRTLVKFLAPGRGPGLFDLESMNAATMRDAVVEWASLVTNIVPRSSARKMMRADSRIGINTTPAD